MSPSPVGRVEWDPLLLSAPAPVERPGAEPRRSPLTKPHDTDGHRKIWDEAGVSYGLCLCGCGSRTKPAPYSHARLGYVKGLPHRYARGHRPANRTEPLVRFLAKLDRSGECWEWRGGCNPAGYGQFGRGGEHGGMTLAHRWAYAHFIGPIPSEQNVLHRCDNPPCCNPDHLFLGTQAENMEDCQTKGRLAYAPRGGTSDFVGVWFDRKREKWVATLGHRNRVKTIGRFAAEVEAASARDQYIVDHRLPHQLNLGP